MNLYNEGKNTVVMDGIIIWDGVSEPNVNDKTGTVQHNLKIAVLDNVNFNGDVNALTNKNMVHLYQKALSEGMFKGAFPPGGYTPFSTIDPNGKLKDDMHLLTGRVGVKAVTSNGVPPIFQNGQRLTSPMQWTPLIYAGAKVNLLVHAYSYSNKSKGIAFGLDGVEIADATLPKLKVTGGMSDDDVASAFAGTAPTAAPVAPTAAPVVPTAPDNNFVVNAARQLTAKAEGATYEQLIAGGWTDETLRQHGLML